MGLHSDAGLEILSRLLVAALLRSNASSISITNIFCSTNYTIKSDIFDMAAPQLGGSNSVNHASAETGDATLFIFHSTPSTYYATKQRYSGLCYITFGVPTKVHVPRTLRDSSRACETSMN